MAEISPGQVRLRGVSRRFRILHEKNLTLKESVVRRRRTKHTDLWALSDVDLDIAPGDALGIVGRNGSGKSTLLKLIAGIIPPHSGTVEMGGTVAAMLELGAGFHPDFTGRENVFMNGAIHGLSDREVEERLPDIVAFSELADFIDMPVRTYSSGMYMRLAFSIAAHVQPDILLLDEVLAVGDEAFQRKCLGRIFEFRRGGGTLIFVSHDPTVVERVCDRVILIDSGKLIEEGQPDRVLATYHRRLVDEPEQPAAAVAAADHVEPAAAAGPPLEDDTTPEPEAEEDVRVWGNREVEITGVRLIGPDGPTDRFLSGDPFAVAIDARPSRPIETPHFGISITTPEGYLCYGTNTRLDSFPITNLAEPVTVRFEVPALNLHEGNFMLTVAVHSRDESIVYHWLDRLTEFTVYQRSTGIGIVDMSGDWRIEPSAEPEAPPSRTIRATS